MAIQTCSDLVNSMDRIMAVQYASHLYIRVDRPLRDDINKAAERAGLNASAFVRNALRTVLDSAPKPSPPQREKAA